MRKKIKELLHKEEGFTLVELLAVIVILGIIVAIAIPTIGNVVGDSQTRANQAEQELVVDAARLYYVSNPEEVPTGTTPTKIDVQTLIDGGFLDIRGSENIEGTEEIEVTATDKGGLTFEYPAP